MYVLRACGDAQGAFLLLLLHSEKIRSRNGRSAEPDKMKKKSHRMTVCSYAPSFLDLKSYAFQSAEITRLCAWLARSSRLETEKPEGTTCRIEAPSHRPVAVFGCAASLRPHDMAPRYGTVPARDEVRARSHLRPVPAVPFSRHARRSRRRIRQTLRVVLGSSGT